MRPRRPAVAVWAFLLVATPACGAPERLDASPRRRPALTTTSATEAATPTSAPIEMTTTSTTRSAPPRESPTTTATSSVSTTTAKTVAPVVWRAEEGGLAVEARLDPQEPRPGETVRLTVHATDTSGGSIAAALNWGDGRMYPIPGAPAPVCTAPADAGSPQPKPEPPKKDPSGRDIVFDHAFRRDGTYGLYLFVRSDHIGCLDDRPGVSLEMRGTVVVTPPDPQPANGPRPPVAGVHQSPEPDSEDSTAVRLIFGGTDSDGFVSRVELDLGDGSPFRVLERPLSECHDEPSYWPSGHLGNSAVHRYPMPGRYTAVVSVTSTGCDGTAVQTASKTIEVEYPVPRSASD